MGMVKRAVTWFKRACRQNRILRTFFQAAGAYLAINIPTFWDGGGDLKLAAETLLLGAIAAGFSALWKTAQGDRDASAK